MPPPPPLSTFTHGNLLGQRDPASDHFREPLILTKLVSVNDPKSVREHKLFTLVRRDRKEETGKDNFSGDAQRCWAMTTPPGKHYNRDLKKITADPTSGMEEATARRCIRMWRQKHETKNILRHLDSLSAD